ncbi:ABC transporter permease [bacterium]|nr:MAG: ABC transporter permease [bacterium]
MSNKTVKIRLRESPSLRLAVLCGPYLLYLSVLYFLPISKIVALSFAAPDGLFKNYITFFSNEVYVVSLERSFMISGLVVSLTALLGYPVALFLANLPRHQAQQLMFFVLLPFWTSVLVRSYAWIVILQNSGIINSTLKVLGLVSQPLPLMFNTFGATVGMTQVLLPFMILSLYSNLTGIDRLVIRAAESMGATRLRIFCQITFPLSLPGLAAGAVLVFVLSLGYYIIPAFLGGAKVLTLATLIELEVNELDNWPIAATAAVILVTLTIALLIAFDRVIGLGRLYRIRGV